MHNIMKEGMTIKKTYPIEVDCANCANQIEAAICKLPGVSSATVNYLTQKLTLDLSEGFNIQEMLRNILSTGQTIDPDFSIEF